MAKNHNFGQILTFGGSRTTPHPFTDEGQIWCAIAHPWYTLTCQISSASVYFVALCWRKPPFLPFFGLRRLMVSTVGSSLRNLDTVAQLRTFPSPTVSTLFVSVLQTPSWQNGTHNLWRSKAWRTNRQTDRQTDRQKKLNVFGHPSGGWNPSPTELDMVIEDLEHVLASRKLLGVWCVVSPLGSAENLGTNRPRQLKTPITL